MATVSAPALVIHGGAGRFAAPDERSPRLDEERRRALREAARAAWDLLAAGGAALDAVELAVRALEDDPSFNAGVGACLTSAGDVEHDASIMDGEALRCGAVAVVKDVRNPITLARRVMERSGHVMLAGPGASAFARAVGLPTCDNAAFVTPLQRARFERLSREAGGCVDDGGPRGTVGAVARDLGGHLAAATSTGGMAMKRPGRVGDSAVIGAGTYADDTLAAVSCTGHGERIIQLGLARLCAELVGQGTQAPEAAALAVRRLGERMRGEAGLIVLGPSGGPGIAFNTQAMARAWSLPDGGVEVAL